MSEYFKPLRRRIGIVTLLLACMFAGGWIRSLVGPERFAASLGHNRVVQLTTNRHAVNLRYGPPTYLEVAVQVRPNPEKLEIAVKLRSPTDESSKADQQVDEFTTESNVPLPADDRVKSDSTPGRSSGQFVIENSDTVAVSSGDIPFWSIVIPLTLLSAWLLLGKPRVAKPNSKA